LHSVHPKKSDTPGRRHYEEVTDSTAPVIDFRQSLHDVSSSAPPRTRSRSGWTEALLRQQKHRCQLRFQHKKTPSFIAVSRVERSAGTGGQRHRRSGDRRDSLQRLLSPAQDCGAATGLVGVASARDKRLLSPAQDRGVATGLVGVASCTRQLAAPEATQTFSAHPLFAA